MPSEQGQQALWPQVIGQARVKNILLSALRAGRLPHAYLFHGPEGVGKDATALALAAVLHCEQGGEEPCGACGACWRIAALQHPDVTLVVPLPVGKGEQSDDDPMQKLSDADVTAVREQLALKGADPYHRVAIPRASIIKINSIRDIRRKSSLSSSDRRKKVFIISRADTMGDDAANTLLKTLEEPSGDTMLILTTAHRDAVLPTILSRCQNVRFDRLTEREISTALAERKGVSRSVADVAARLADGSYARAVELLSDDVAQRRADVVQFVRHALGGNPVQIIRSVETVADLKDREMILRFLSFMLLWFRDALVLSRGGAIINQDQQEDLQRFVTRFPQADLVRVINDVERAILRIDRNVFVKLALTDLAIRLRDAIMEPAPSEEQTTSA